MGQGNGWGYGWEGTVIILPLPHSFERTGESQAPSVLSQHRRLGANQVQDPSLSLGLSISPSLNATITLILTLTMKPLALENHIKHVSRN